ncbi:MAG: hypothetical protein WEA77_09395 [Hyphomonas sp.]|uniref:hypothetical protein n=1 Tax=Hyphomonas sp. TaxID=87 RepID=UPI0034A0993C
MKLIPAFAALVVAAGLAACSQTQDERASAPVPVDLSVETDAYAASGTPEIPVETGPWTLTSFTPATEEIYCSFYTIGDDGRRGERVFVTKIAGVAAPAYVDPEGEEAALTQVSVADDRALQVWLCENPGRSLLLEMQVTETGERFQSRDYEGTAQVILPEQGPLTAVTWTGGV